MSLEKDYGYSHLLSDYQQPLPPESRKGWLVVFSALAVLFFGIWAINVISSGLEINSDREDLNQALQMESRLRDALLKLDRP
ncbi:MAG: hypothetical protein ACRECJ_08945, partial [Limisphaerales bacterium]